MKFRIPGLKELANKLEDDEIIESDSAEGMSGETLYGEDEFESGSPFFHEPSEEQVRNPRGISLSSSDGTGQDFAETPDAGSGEKTGDTAFPDDGTEQENPDYSGRESGKHAAPGGDGHLQRRPATLRAMLTGYGVWAAVILVVCILLELFFFNYGHWHSPGGREMTDRAVVSAGSAEPYGSDPEDGSGESADSGQPDGFTVSLGDGLERTEYGTYLVTDEEQAYLSLRDINEKVDTLYLNVVNPAAPDVHYTILFTDSANADLRSLQGRTVVSGVPESRYVTLHFAGTTRSLRISFNAEEGDELHIHRVRLNVRVPLFFHPGRVLLIWLLGMLLVIFGPRSWVYTTRLNLREGRQRFLVAAILLINIIATASAAKAADPTVWRELRDERDYQEKEYELYAEALLKGHTWLDIRPPRYLTRMRNPYDRFQRDALADQYDEKVLWDVAYYNGRYYVYFGIVPAILSFVPVRLVTGRALPTWKAVQGMAVLLWLASFYLIYVLVRKYFKKISLGIYLLLAMTFVFASGVIYLVTFPVVYSVPFIYGLVFSIAGLALWLRSFDRKGNPHRMRMVIGSLLIALTLGCRPTMILSVILAFPVFWEQIREGKFFVPKKESLLNTGAVILPFIPVGLLQMILNKSRFGSPFDFGADYNLTVTDLTKKTYSITRNIPVLFQELVQPLHIEPQFPFITGVEVTTGFQGYMFKDKMIGGFFALNMLALFCFWIFRIRKKMRAQKVFGLAATAFGIAALLVELDVQIGGISQRYMIDYGWLFMLTAILAILTILETTDKHGYFAYLKIILVLTALCVVVNYLSVFSDGIAIPVRRFNPELFYKIQYLLAPMG